MCGGIIPLPCTFSWHGTKLSRGYILMVWYLLKPSENFTFRVIQLMRMKWAKHVGFKEEMRNVYIILVEKWQGKR